MLIRPVAHGIGVQPKKNGVRRGPPGKVAAVPPLPSARSESLDFEPFDKPAYAVENAKEPQRRRSMMAHRKHQSTTKRATVAAYVNFALGVVVLLILAWMIYGRSLDAPYIFDDLVSVEDNPSIRQLWPLFGDAENPGPLRPPTETPVAARPLLNLSFALDFHFWRGNPRGYRITNLLLHVVNAALLWMLVRRSLLLPYFESRYDNVASVLGFAAAMIWLVHPLASEAVVYITQRSELLVTFCYLATLYASLRYWTSAASRSRQAWLAVAIIACFAGAAAKEVMVTAPVIVLLFDRTLISGTFRKALQDFWPLYVGLAASWILVVALQLPGPRKLSAGFGLGTPLVDYWSTQARVLLMYLKLALLPDPLLIHYELSLESLAENWLSVLAVLVVLAGVAYLLWNRSAIGLLLAAALAVLAPTHLVPIPPEMAAERRMYLPLAALATLVIVGGYTLVAPVIERITRGLHVKNALRLWAFAGLIVIFVVLLFSFMAAKRAAEYNNPSILWQQVADRQPNSHVAHHGLAVRLYEEDRLAEAVEHYRVAVRLHPNYPEAQFGLGMALLNLGKADEAVDPLREAVRLKPKAERIQNALGVALFSAGRFEEAIPEFKAALKLNPKMWEVHENLARALQQLGRRDEAQRHIAEAARLKHNHAPSTR